VTLALVLTIALGIGSNAVVHGFVRGLVAHDSPLTAAGGIVSLFERDAHRAAGPLSYDDYLTLATERNAFERLGAAREFQATVIREEASAILSVASVTPELADLLTLPLEDGVVISHAVWLTEFDGKAQVRGELIRIDGLDYRVDGIAPEWLDGLYAGRAVDIWMPLREESLQETERSSRSFWVVGRLRSGISIAEAEAAVNARRRDNASETGIVRYTGMTPETTEGYTRLGRLLGIAAGAVMLIACANVAAFLLGRASERSREASIRVALGARRGRLARQLLSDSLLLSAIGGAAGVLLAMWTSDILPALFFEEDAEHLVFAPDLVSIAAAAGVCAVLTLACGLLPLLEVRDDCPAAVLRREGVGPSKAMRRLRTGLVVAQMTCCCVLLISSGLLVQGFRTAVQTRAAHRVGEVILASVQARPGGGAAYFADVEQAARSTAGVTVMAWASKLPGSRPVWQSLRVEPLGLPRGEVTLDSATFTRELLPRITLPPIAGRMFGGRDTAQSCRVAIVNEEAARALFDGDAVGRSIEDVTRQSVEIIGVVGMRTRPGASSPRPTLYYYDSQGGSPLDRDGPAIVRAPVGSKLARALLDATIVSPGYFEAMGLSTTTGRSLGPQASRACRVAVVNEEAAELYFGGNAVGSAVIDGVGRRTEIIGVVQSEQLRTFQRRAEPAIYVQMSEDLVPRMTLILSGRTDEDTLTGLHHRLEAVPGAFTPPAVKTLEMHLRRTALAPLRLATVLVGAFAATALALGVLGLYGALADAARQRRREIAVRIVLGAPGWRVIRQVMGEGGRLAGAGAVAGMIGSIVAARQLTGVVPAAPSVSVWVWVAAPLVLLGAAAMASVLPACRALTVDPLTIARDDT
jgi:predicted permease